MTIPKDTAPAAAAGPDGRGTDAARRAPLRPTPPVDERCRATLRADGSWLIEREQPLADYPRRQTDRLLQWAAQRPEHVFLARRPPGREHAAGVWEEWTYGRSLAAVRSIGQALLDRGLTPQRPVMILSENDVEHQLLALACSHVGLVHVPVTPAYSLLSQDHARLKWLNERVRPGLVFASDGDAYRRAFDAAFPGVEWVATRPGGSGATPFASLLATTAGTAVDAAHDRVGPDDIAKLLFTSGTTGEPKGVLLTHRMVCSNRQQTMQALPFLLEQPLVLVDWLPWHHTFGGTANVGNALYCGGSYYIDPGKPTPDGIEATVQAYREIAPTLYCNTPSGIGTFLPYLREDAALRERFFSRLSAVLAGGAVFPPHIWKEFDEVSVAHHGHRLLFVSGLGSTECGPVPAITCRDGDRRMLVGVPVPGVTAKLVPVEAGLELRFKGPCVSPGYWNDPERSVAVRDEEGFFRMGDAVAFIDERQPEIGLLFAGRIADNFKLHTGTWVLAAPLRAAALQAFAPLVTEVVITGEGREQVGALLFPDVERCRQLDPALPADAAPAAVLANPRVREAFALRLATLAAGGQGSAGRIARVRLESEPLTLDTGELTAKGAVSASTVLRRRQAAVADLHGPAPSATVLVAAQS